MNKEHFSKAALLAFFIVVAATISWELFLRNRGVDTAYNDDQSLWADKRSRVYSTKTPSTVFIGSSRIKFDLDVPTWKELTGEDAIQLAMEGTSPVPILEDLANDPKFKGKLVVDVTEGLYFSYSHYDLSAPRKNAKFFKEETPAQKAGFQLNRVLESRLALLDKDNYSMNALLDKLELKSRPGVFMMPIFPMEFSRTSFERQAIMTDKFIADTSIQNVVKNIWLFFAKMNTDPPASGKQLDSMFQVTAGHVAKIKARGGQVIFVRTPSSGPFWEAEQKGFPREKYWDRLIVTSGADGIHFKDHPEIANFICPEWSHLTPKDAAIFTKHFVALLQQKNWFNNTAIAER